MNLREGRESFVAVLVPVVAGFLISAILVMGVFIYASGCRFVCIGETVTWTLPDGFRK